MYNRGLSSVTNIEFRPISETVIPLNPQKFELSIVKLCHASWSCELATANSDLWLLSVVAFTTVVALASTWKIRRAKDLVEEEQSRTAAERDAFDAFAKRVNNISVDNRITSDGTDGMAVASAIELADSTNNLRKVREAYRETVMSVSHYNEEYAESIEENMFNEFGHDVATSVTDAQEFSPLLQQALVSKAQEAASKREGFMDRLRNETEELDKTQNKLTSIKSQLNEFGSLTLRGFDVDEFIRRWKRLDEFEDLCVDLINHRQRTLLTYGDEDQTDGPTFTEYLYSPLQVDHPILAEAVELLEEIEDAREEVTRVIIRQS